MNMVHLFEQAYPPTFELPAKTIGVTGLDGLYQEYDVTGPDRVRYRASVGTDRPHLDFGDGRGPVEVARWRIFR